MKLVIQIPCYNEAETLPTTMRELPRELPGIDCIEYLVIDDGSSDGTSEVARECGAHQVVRLLGHEGLARAFSVGLRASLARGADIVVNTDGDNQYCAADIGKLVNPILGQEADIVVGARPIEGIQHFSPVKKLLQRLGSWGMRKLSGTSVPDATSGFRAFTRDAAFRLNVFSGYTYTLETLIQAGLCNIRVASVPIRINGPLRESRLIKSIPGYIRRSAVTMARVFVLYKPLRFFFVIGSLLFLAGFLVGLRFLYFYFTAGGQGHIQSLVLGAALLLMGFQLGIMGIVADLIATNRRLLEDVQYRLRRHEQSSPPVEGK